MLIRLLQEREGGTVVPFGEKGTDDRRLYQFKPNASGDHVAEVVDEQDIITMLAIPESFVDATPRSVVKRPAESDEDRAAREAAANKEDGRKGKFLDAMDRESLEKYATAKGVKLDQRHTDDQARNYLKGLIAVKG